MDCTWTATLRWTVIYKNQTKKSYIFYFTITYILFIPGAYNNSYY